MENQVINYGWKYNFWQIFLVVNKETECESFNLIEKGTPSFTRKHSHSIENFRYEVSFENITQQEKHVLIGRWTGIDKENLIILWNCPDPHQTTIKLIPFVRRTEIEVDWLHTLQRIQYSKPPIKTLKSSRYFSESLN